MIDLIRGQTSRLGHWLRERLKDIDQFAAAFDASALEDLERRVFALEADRLMRLDVSKVSNDGQKHRSDGT